MVTQSARSAGLIAAALAVLSGCTASLNATVAPAGAPADPAAAGTKALAAAAGIVGNSGGNIVGNSGGNIVGNSGGNIVGNSGGNIVGNSGGNIVGNAGGSMFPDGVRGALESKLLGVAKVGFAATQANLIANNAGSLIANNSGGLVSNNAGSLIGNNAGGLVSNNSGGLVSNNSGGLVSNNSGGLVSNNSGGLIGNNAGGYSLLQAAEALPMPTLPASVTPEAGEKLILYVPGEAITRYAFDTADGGQHDYWVDAEGRKRVEERSTNLQFHANGNFKTGDTVREIFDEQSRRISRLAFAETYTDKGVFTGLVHKPSDYELPDNGVKVTIEKLEISLPSGTGSFICRYKHLGVVESGSFDGVIVDQKRGIAINLVDPLATFGGSAEAKDESGKRLYSRIRSARVDILKTTLDLGDGLLLKLQQRSLTEELQGTVSRRGAPLGSARQLVEKDGSYVFGLVLGDKPGAETFVRASGTATVSP